MLAKRAGIQIGGVWFEGGYRVDTLSPDDRADLNARSAERSVREWDQRARTTLRRSHAEQQALAVLCEWLASHSLDVLATFTFSDQVAQQRGIYSIERAIEDVRRGLRFVYFGRGRRVGFENRYVLAGEWHPSGRKIPHVHGVLEAGDLGVDRVCSRLFDHFLHTSGRCRFEPMRDVDTATLYGLKDTLKGSASSPHAYSLRLARSRRSRGRGKR